MVSVSVSVSVSVYPAHTHVSERNMVSSFRRVLCFFIVESYGWMASSFFVPPPPACLLCSALLCSALINSRCTPLRIKLQCNAIVRRLYANSRNTRAILSHRTNQYLTSNHNIFNNSIRTGTDISPNKYARTEYVCASSPSAIFPFSILDSRSTIDIFQ